MGGVDGGVCPELLVSPEDKRSYRMIALGNGLVALLVHDPEIGELLVEQRCTQKQEGESSAESRGTQQRPKRQRAGGGFGMGCCASAPKTSDEESQSMGSEDDEEDDYSDEEGDSGDEEGPKTKSAAAALTVGVGSFADPPHVQGLAHFLEHMLFMGSERYTDENEAEEYLSAHGGYSNAYTDVEHTTFYFELEPGPGVLDGALDRWSAFFSCPLIKEECLGREIDAVNSEFQGVEQNDTCRQQQLLSHDAKPGHPCCNFLWGNAKSLKSATRDDLMSFWKQHYNASVSKLVILGGESLDELEAMAHKYFDELRPRDTAGSTSYSAGGRGPPNITGLTSKPRDKPPPFPPPPPAPTQAATESIATAGSGDGASVSPNPFATESMGELLLTLPVADAHTLSLVWPLPPLRPYYQYATDDYISHILGHEGEGSLTSQLKKKGWINELMCGVEREDGLQCNSMFSLMVVELSLTEDGLKHYHDVISAVYQYLALMRAEPGPQKWVYDELKAVREMRFRFHQEISADEYVQSLAADMLTYAQEHTLSGGFLYKEWDAGLVVALLGYMMPWNMRAILASHTDEHTARVEAAAAAAERAAKQAAKEQKKANSKSASPSASTSARAGGGKEPWFGVSFARERFADDKMAAWAAGAAPDDSACIVVGLHLVPPNHFIATEFSLLPPTVKIEGSAVDAPLDRPTRIPLDDDAGGVLSVWHKADSIFRTPRATMSFRFATAGFRGSVLAAVFSALFVELIRDGFNETVYMAEQAGINIELRLTDCSLELYASGFSHKLLTCANAYLGYIRGYTISSERFKYLLEDYIRMCKNQNISPEVHATYLRLHILQRELASTCAQRLEFARNEAECNAESIQRWMKEHLIPDPVTATRKVAATAFIMGNIGVDETSSFGAAAAAAFGVSTEGADQKFHPENRVVKLKRLTLIQVSTVATVGQPIGAVLVVF
jgi:nardilysin